MTKRIRPYAVEQQHGAFRVPRIATGTVVLYDETALLGVFDQLRFVGAGVSLGDFGSYAEVNIPGGAGGGGGGLGLFFTEDGVPLGTGVRLDSGYGLDLAISGTTVRVQVAPPISGSVILRDEGTLLGSVTGFDFVGPGVSASQAGGLATIAVPGPGVDQIGFFALDNGVPLGTGTRLNAGYGLRASLSGSTLEIEVETPVSGTLVVRDEGINQGSAPVLDFVGAGVTASIGGGVATITIPGGAGGGAGLFFTDDGVPIGTGVRLDTGYGLDLSISGTTVRIQVAPPISGSVVLSDEGTVLGSAARLDFVGPGVSASLAAGVGTIAVPGPGVDQIGFFATDDGIPLGTGTRLEAGYGIDANLSGTTLEIRVETPVTGTVVLRDEGVTQGSAPILDFVGAGVTAAVAGGVATITIPAGAGGTPGVDQIGLFFTEDGVPLGTGVRFDSGYGLDIAISGTTVRVDVKPPISGSVILSDEGNLLGSASRLNFVGPGVSASLAGGVGTVAVPGPGVDQIGLFFTEDGVPIGTGVRFDSGYGLDISISGTTVRMDVRPPISGTVVLSDEGNLLGSAQRFNFVGPGVSASLAGDVGTVAIPGPGVDQIGVFATDDGVPLGTGTRLESGYGIDASFSGTTLEIRVETPVTGSVVIRDEGVNQGSAPVLDFVGAGVTAAVGGGVATITIPGGGSTPGVDQIGLFFTEEGVPLGTGVRLDSGYGLDISISGTTVRMDVRPPITGSIVLRDEATLLGSVREMNFVGPGVSASQAGGVATVSIPGAGADQIGLFFTEEGVPLGTGVRLDSGYGLDLSISGTTVRFDVRPPVSGTVLLSDEGNLLGSAQRLNFVGPGVSASLAGLVGSIAIPGPGVDQIGIFFTEDGVPLGTGVRLDSGYGLDISISGTTVRMDVRPPISGSVVVRDEGILLGSALDLDFVGAGVTATISGTRAQVSIPGGASSPPTVQTGTFRVKETVYSVQLGNTTGAIVVANIPQLYDRLEWTLLSRGTSGSVAFAIPSLVTLLMYFSGDTGTSRYQSSIHQATHSSPAGTVPVAGAHRAFAFGSVAVAGQMLTDIAQTPEPMLMRGIIDYPHVTGTYHHMTWESVVPFMLASGSHYQGQTTWKAKESIRSMRLTIDSQVQFLSGSRFDLYGERDQVLVTAVN